MPMPVLTDEVKRAISSALDCLEENLQYNDEESEEDRAETEAAIEDATGFLKSLSKYQREH